MYAKNNLGSLGKVHSNVFLKPQSPTILRLKPLSQIQNSIEKMKARKKKSSKSKSKSKQNTPQNDRYQMKRPNIGGLRNNNYFNSPQQRIKQSIIPSNLKNNKTPFNDFLFEQAIHSQTLLKKASSQLSLNSNKMTESNSSSCVSSEYQLPVMSLFSQKSVKFSDQNIQTNTPRLNTKKFSQKDQPRLKTPSILKKKSSITSRSNSIKSALKFQRTKKIIDIQNLGPNKLIKNKFQALNKKYEDVNKKFGKNQTKMYLKLEKFTDQIFPPQNSSVFSSSIHSRIQKPKDQIIWKRIPELYPNIQQLIVLRQQSSKSLIKITKDKSSLAEDYFVNSLNCIRQNKKLLEKIFQIKQINPYGFYLVKIFQEDSWKYVIIDDFIPTFFDQVSQNYVPAFLNVEKAEGNSSQQIQIWPFLLQKAYAAYYSKYQALKYGKQIDFLSELTGVSYRQIKIQNLDFKNNEHLQIQNSLRQQKIILIGEKILNQNSIYSCILPDLNLITKKAHGFCSILTKQKGYKPIRQKLQAYLRTLTSIYLYQLQPFPHNSQSYLCPETKRNQGKFNSKKQSLQSIEQNDITLKFFTITQLTKSVLTIRQKDCRFYFQGKNQYRYIWIRAILLLKELNGDYRWIDGIYSNEKSLTFFLKLQPGDYYLLLMPQWNQNYKYDVMINLMTESRHVMLQKKPYNPVDEIFQKGCADIAQRQGCLNQINKYICAYNLISVSTGLIIENINNQRQTGPVTVLRSINGLKSKVDLVPVNKQFFVNNTSEYSNYSGKKLKKTIQVDIQPGSSFTVVIKTVGGIDKKFFDSFDFGS